MLSDLAWIAAGAFTSGTGMLAVRSLRSPKREHRASTASASAWTAALAATEPVRGGVHDSDMFAELINDATTRSIAIRALANAARTGQLNEPMHGLTVRAASQISLWLTAELGHDDPGRRAEALELAATLRVVALRGRIMEAAHDDDQVVRVAACRALAVVDPRRAIGELLRLVEIEGAWAVDLLADIMERNNADFTDAIVARVEQWASTPALVGLLASSKAPTGESALVVALDRQDPGDANPCRQRPRCRPIAASGTRTRSVAAISRLGRTHGSDPSARQDRPHRFDPRSRAGPRRRRARRPLRSSDRSGRDTAGT